MDARLQQLHRLASADQSYLPDLIRACERAQVLGPVIAQEMHLLASLYQQFFIENRQFSLDTDILIEDFAEVSWSTPVNSFTRESYATAKQIIGSLYEFATEGELVEEEQEGEISFEQPQIDQLVDLFIFADDNSDKEFQIYYHNDIKGIVLEQDNMETFGEMINSACRHTIYDKWATQFADIGAKLYQGDYFEVWGEFAPEEYEEAAQLLPKNAYQKFVEEAEEQDQDLGEYLKQTRNNIFLPALLQGYESHYNSELYKQWQAFLEDIDWESGAITIYINNETILTWISLEGLAKFVWQQLNAEFPVEWPCDYLREDVGFDDLNPYWEDRIYGTDKDVIKEVLMNELIDSYLA
tara:strand:+ start:275 stop:1336 length:1062 start_codon:yes stop_codon:yes gene_type:complete